MSVPSPVPPRRVPAASVAGASTRARQVLDSLPDALIACDADDRVLDWNAAATQLFGITAEAAIGRRCTELVAALDQVADHAARTALAAGVEPGPMRLLLPDADGTQQRWVELRWRRLCDEEGRPTGHLRLLRDLTPAAPDEDAHRTLDELRHANERMADARAVRTAFLAKMSHEMRTPLNAILGFADLLLAGVARSDSDKGREYLRLLRESGAALLGLVDDLMDLSAVEAGRLEFEPTELDVAREVQRTVEMMMPAARRRLVRLTVDVSQAPQRVRFDARRLRQVLLNFLSNAVKFAPSPGGQVQVRVRTRPQGRWRLEVQDDGPGIPEDQRGLLFQEFQRLPGNRHSTGTGLGLALTRRIVESRGGRVGMTAAPGGGSVFHAELPLDDLIDGAASPAAAAASGPTTVYIVAAAEPLVETAEPWVRSLGLEPRRVPSLGQAVREAEARAIREIVLDVRVGEAMARELLQAAQQYGRDHPGTCIVLQLRAGAHVAEYAVSTQAPRPASEREPAAEALPASLLQGLRVLVVDDDPSLCAMVEDLLQQHGATPRTVTDSRRALQTARAFEPHLVLIDLIMPGLSGFDLLDAMRGAWREGRLRETPVVVWTNKTLTAEEYLRLARDADAVLSKAHVDPDAMLRLIGQLGRDAMAG